MSSQQSGSQSTKRALLPVLTMAIGFTLPFLVSDKSWGQPSTQASDILYYGWQAEGQQIEGQQIEGQQIEGQQIEGQQAHEPALHLTLEPDWTMANAAPAQTEANQESSLSLADSLAEPTLSSEVEPALPLSPGSYLAPHPVLSQTVTPFPLELGDALSPPLSQADPALETVPEDSAVSFDRAAPEGIGQTVAGVEVRFVDRDGQIVEGHTRPSIIRRELSLQAGTAYDQALAQQGLDRILELDIVRDADIALEPAAEPDQVTLVVVVKERSPLAVGFGPYSSFPTALQGPFQQNPVLGAGNNENAGFSADGHLRLLNIGGNDQSLTFQLRGGERVFDTELSFSDPWIGNQPTGVSVNVFNQRSVQGVFTDGDRDIDLPNGNTPWVHRLGGGIEVFRPVSADLTVALGATYQRVSVHNSAFETETFTRDELGERLVVSDSGYDDLLTVSFAADLDRRDNPDNPERGSRFRFGLDQSIPIGDANLNFTRFSASYAQFIPLNLFGFAEGPRTLVLNLQAGTILGDVPPYEAFNLSSGPLSDYSGDSFGTGSSFALLGAEYRFPIVNFNLLRQDVRLGGHVFGGYATTLGTDNEVIGEPSISRDKPGEGWGYGIGLRAKTNFGIFRLEFGLNDLGESRVVFTAGDRF